MSVEQRKSDQLKFNNLLWKLKIAFKKYDQTNVKFTRLTTESRYRAGILVQAAKQTDDLQLQRLAQEIISWEKTFGSDTDLIEAEEEISQRIENNKQSKAKHKSYLLWRWAAVWSMIFVSALMYFAWPMVSWQVEAKVATEITDNSTQQPVDGVDGVDGVEIVASSIPETSQSTKSLTTNSSGSVEREPPLLVSSTSAVPVKRNIELLMRIHGSNTVGEKLAPELIKAYLTKLGAQEITLRQGDADVEKSIEAFLPDRGWVSVEIHAHGSSTAFKDLLAGSTDMGMSSRKVKVQEVEQLKAEYGDLSASTSEHIVGLDGLAIIVHPSNPINQLTTEQVAKLFSGEINDWSQLGQAPAPVTIYARDNNSGTWDTFKNLVLKKYQKSLVDVAGRFESSSELSDLVAADPNAIGFIGLPYVRQAKLLAIADDDNTLAILPTRFTVGTEDYPLARRLYLYTPKIQSDFMRRWVTYSLSNFGQSVVQEMGFVSQNLYEVKPRIATNAPEGYKQLVGNAKRLSLNFRFKPGSTELDNKALRDIKRLADYIQSNPSKQLMLLGFADSIGDPEINKKLSYQRAAVIEQKLQSRGIFAPNVVGFGEELAVASNMTSAGRDKNRRVEAWIY